MTTRTVPHTIDPRWPAIPPDRFAATFRTDSPEGCSVALLGLPDDTGVRLNNGRPGAALGPMAFRAALARFGTTFDADHTRLIPVNVFDAGDVAPASSGRPADDLHETHRRIADAAAKIHELGMIAVCIGGGHDLTVGAVGGFARHTGRPVGGINADPHLDVRDAPGSGMAFRALLESGAIDGRRFVEWAVSRFANTREHTEFLLLRHASVVTIDKVFADMPSEIYRAFAAARGDRSSPIFVSVDLDVLDGAHAPGVSAVNPSGLSPHELARFVDAAGRDPLVRHFEIMELCPAHDDPPTAGESAAGLTPGRTARLAAFLFLTFVAALADRPAS